MDEERLEIEIDNAIKDGIKSTIKIFNGKRMKKKVLVSDYRNIIKQTIKGTIFEQIRQEKFINKALDLFEPNKIIIKEK